MSTQSDVRPKTTPCRITLGEAFWTWSRVAALSFGGPAGQIAVMHRIIVEEKKWIDERRFLHALNYCMLLPGPEAQQLATYLGWLMHGTVGGLMAGTLFILPGFVTIMALSVIYAWYQQADLLTGLFLGLKPAVAAIVFEAVLRIGRRVLKNGVMLLAAILSFLCIFLLDIPFPILIGMAGLLGAVGGRLFPDSFLVVKPHGSAEGKQTNQQAPPEIEFTVAKPSWRRAITVSAICLSLWFAPLAVVAYWLGPESVWFREGIFFSQAAVVTFGGAYSVLAYIAQQAVEKYHWLRPGEMLDGLGMAETTPGPLIMVVQFVGFLGAYRNPAGMDPLAAGILGAALTVWVTFVPCFYWIFLGAPYIERLRENRLLNAALSTITAAVVGVVLNLALWFSLHTLFARVDVVWTHGVRWLIPDFSSLRPASLLIAIAAGFMTFVWKKGMGWTLAASTSAGVVWHFAAKLWG